MRQLIKMNTTSKNQIKLKDGRIFSTGENFNVVPSIDRPDYGAPFLVIQVEHLAYL